MSEHQDVIIPKAYLRIVDSDKKVIVFYGGRGGGKTEGIARVFLSIAYQFENINIFCARETQDEFCSTLMLVFKRIIREDPQFSWMKDYCVFYRDRIEFESGSVISFMGLSAKTEDKIKGIIANYFWFDEAHGLRRDTYELLIPSIREYNSKVILSFNPRFDYDFVGEEFLKNPASNVEVIQINAKDNPYLSEDLKNQMEIDRVRLSYEEFLWKWEGGFKPQSDTALFDLDALRTKFYLNKDFDSNDFLRIAIGIDPATTSKDYSNESGLVVAGLNHNKEAVVIEDATGHLKPNDLARKTSELYHRYGADAVVVEVNQGGDYIKNTLLGYDSSLRVIEVRAKQDKVNRMLPIANELYLGRIKALSEKVGFGIATQFRKFTNNGYLGAKGESPDRAEAFAWVAFELLGITEYGTEGLVFKRNILACEIVGAVFKKNIGVLYSQGGQFGLIVGNIYKQVDGFKFKAVKAIKGDLSEFSLLAKDLEIIELYCNDAIIGRSINLAGIRKKTLYTLSDIEEIALGALPTLSEKVNVVECEEFCYLGNTKNWLLYDLLKYQVDKETLTPLVGAFFGLIHLLK